MPKVKKKKKKRRPPVSKGKRTKKKKSSAKIKRTSSGKYPKGVSGNPKGRPKGSGHKYSVGELETAIEVVEEKKGETFLQAWIECAWGNAGEMAAIANFMMPKLRAIEMQTLAEDALPKEQADRIRKEMEERFKR